MFKYWENVFINCSKTCRASEAKQRTCSCCENTVQADVGLLPCFEVSCVFLNNNLSSEKGFVIDLCMPCMHILIYSSFLFLFIQSGLKFVVVIFSKLKKNKYVRDLSFVLSPRLYQFWGMHHKNFICSSKKR